jgi:hypothetical protein
MLRLEDVDLGGAAAFVGGWARAVFPRTCVRAGGMKKAWGYQLGGSARR